MAGDTKRDRCPACGKPYTGRLKFTAAEFSIEIEGVRTTSSAASFTYLHAGGKRCVVESR
jgi:hypothetical protein